MAKKNNSKKKIRINLSEIQKKLNKEPPKINFDAALKKKNQSSKHKSKESPSKESESKSSPKLKVNFQAALKRKYGEQFDEYTLAQQEQDSPDEFAPQKSSYETESSAEPVIDNVDTIETSTEDIMPEKTIEDSVEEDIQEPELPIEPDKIQTKQIDSEDMPAAPQKTAQVDQASVQDKAWPAPIEKTKPATSKVDIDKDPIIEEHKQEIVEHPETRPEPKEKQTTKESGPATDISKETSLDDVVSDEQKDIPDSDTEQAKNLEQERVKKDYVQEKSDYVPDKDQVLEKSDSEQTDKPPSAQSKPAYTKDKQETEQAKPEKVQETYEEPGEIDQVFEKIDIPKEQYLDNFSVLKRKFKIDPSGALYRLIEQLESRKLSTADEAVPKFLEFLLTQDPKYNAENKYKLCKLETKLNGGK